MASTCEAPQLLPLSEPATLDHDAATGSPDVAAAHEDAIKSETTSHADDVPPVYSVFTSRQKWAITSIASMAAIFGPISSNIYVPAIPQMAADFGRSTQDINLTLTIYLVFQAVSPSVLAGLSDSLGRRPVLLFCLAVYTGACVGIALTPTSSFWLLMLMRALQAIGGSPAIGTGAGTVSDIALPSERGKFMGVFQGVALIGPAMGPVIGGLLVQYRSWRWVFWFLAISCAVTCVFIFFTLPETLRCIVGNGSIKPPRLNARPRLVGSSSYSLGHETRTLSESKKPFAAFQMLLYPEILLTLWFGSCAFMCMFAALTVYSSVLSDGYGYSDIVIGVCYLPQGLGSMVIGIWGGRVHDWHFARVKKRLGFVPRHARDLDGLPIEAVRFHWVPYYLPVFFAAVIGYGWSLDRQVSIAAPLALSFLVGMGAQFSTQMCSLLLIDMFPSHSGASQAAFNLVRCAMSAVAAAVVDLMIAALGLGWTFTIFAAIMLSSWPAIVLLQAKGPDWRGKRLQEWGVGGV